MPRIQSFLLHLVIGLFFVIGSLCILRLFIEAMGLVWGISTCITVAIIAVVNVELGADEEEEMRREDEALRVRAAKSMMSRWKARKESRDRALLQLQCEHNPPKDSEADNGRRGSRAVGDVECSSATSRQLEAVGCFRCIVKVHQG